MRPWFDVARLPRGLFLGVSAGLGAGALWGTSFIAPLWLPEFSSMDITVGRYVACGVFSLLLLLLERVRSGPAAWPTPPQMGAALGLAALGYWGYYLLLVWGIALAGATLPVLVIGTIPLWLMCLGKPPGLRWAALLPGLALTALGLALMVDTQATHASPASQHAPLALWRGLMWAALSAAAWTVFGLLNARWMRQHPEVSSALWACWQGVGAGVGALFLAWAWASPWHTLVQHPAWWRFVLVCTLTGIGSAWVASVLWNMASRRLSASLAGQLVVSETLFGLVYAYAHSGQWPSLAQALASVAFVLGMLLSIRAHRSPPPPPH